jgi:transposase
MQVVRIGLDLAKYVFEVHGVDGQGNVVIRKTLRRGSVATFFANLPPCLVGMEASNGAHYWARVLTELGHKVRLISPQFVAPYVNRTKTIEMMRRLSARQSADPRCALFRRSRPNSWRSKLSIGFASA